MDLQFLRKCGTRMWLISAKLQLTEFCHDVFFDPGDEYVSCPGARYGQMVRGLRSDLHAT